MTTELDFCQLRPCFLNSLDIEKEKPRKHPAANKTGSQKPKKEPGPNAPKKNWGQKQKKELGPMGPQFFCSAFGPGSFLSFWPNAYSNGFLPGLATLYIKGCPVQFCT